MIGKNSIRYPATIDSTHPLGVGCVASFDLLEGPVYGKNGIRCAARRNILPASGVTNAGWSTSGGKRVFQGDGSGTGVEYFIGLRQCPIVECPFTIVLRVYCNTTTPGTFYVLVSGGDSTRHITIDGSTTLRVQVRNGGGSANATDFLQLTGPTISTSLWYTLVFSAWGGRSSLCKMWTKRDDEGTVNSYVAASDFAMGFPTGLNNEKLGGGTTVCAGLIEIVRLYRFGVTDTWANDVCKAPHKLYGALLPARRVRTVLPSDIRLPGAGVFPRMVS